MILRKNCTHIYIWCVHPSFPICFLNLSYTTCTYLCVAVLGDVCLFPISLVAGSSKMSYVKFSVIVMFFKNNGIKNIANEKTDQFNRLYLLFKNFLLISPW